MRFGREEPLGQQWKGHPKEEDPLKKTKKEEEGQSGWKEKQEKQGDLLSWKPREEEFQGERGQQCY